MMTRTARRIFHDEQGVAMVLTIMLSVVILALAGAVVFRAVSNYNQVGFDRAWERALHVADSGIDHGLYQLRQNDLFTTGETIPGSFATPADEEQWVQDRAADAYTSDPSRAVHTSEGDWVIVRPSNEPQLYSVGYVPTIDDPSVVRVVAVNYDFAPYAPVAAVVTGGDLRVIGNPSFGGANGSAHANGNVDVSGVPTFTAYLSASGTYSPGGASIGDPANSGGGRPPHDIPVIDPRDAYRMSEYDLCPDGRVRTGPNYAAGPEAPNPTRNPCAGTVLADATAGSFRGWQYQGSSATAGAQWRYGNNSSYDGVYFVHLGSATVSGSPGSVGAFWNATIMASASGTCNGLVGGDVKFSGTPRIRPHEKGQPFLIVAQRDFEIGGNSSTNFTGALVAGEQFRINGNPVLVGQVLAKGGCDSPGSLVPAGSVQINGDVSITYDGGIELPLGDSIRITHWNEL